MKFNIITLGSPERKPYMDNIRSYVPYEEIQISAVDGASVDLQEELHMRGLRGPWHDAGAGEVGVWLSNFDAWKWCAENDELIVFEDDAVVNATFGMYFKNFYDMLPENWDFASLWVPENQIVDYRYDVIYKENGEPIISGVLPYSRSKYKCNVFVAHVYQGYGMVSLLYKPSGAAKLIERARQTGLRTPVDCWIYEEAHMGNLNGYAPTPIRSNIVHYDWKATTTVHTTERVIYE